MLRTAFLLSVFVWCGSHGLPRSVRSAWLLGPQGSGDCDSICSDQSARCSEGMGQRAAADNKILELTSWYHHGCKGYNAWDYGQGFSECTDPACCVDGSCQNHCSITSSWPGCGDIGNFNGHHSRICPCEFLAPSPTSPPPPPERCPDGWELFYGNCYKYMETRKTWAEAEAVCNGYTWNGVPGHLASVHSEEENDFVASFAKERILLGGHDTHKKGRFEWSDGTTFTYQNWADNEPSSGNENCLEIPSPASAGKHWNDRLCSTKEKFVCKLTKKCPEGWFYFKGKCYGHPQDKKLSWTEANSYCQNWSLGAHLASIHSLEEKEFVQTKFPRNIWLGGNDRAKEGRWVWSDGTPWDYSDWDNQQPDNLRGQHCLMGNWHNLKWDDAGCPLQNLFLCMK